MGRAYYCLLILSLVTLVTSFAIISQRKNELVALQYLSSWFHFSVSALCLILTVSSADLQCVIAAFSGASHSHFILFSLF